VAELEGRPYPPGRYPVVVLGTGPGGIQASAALGALGVEHALLSADDEPAGMFRQFPFFQRLITWSKPYAPAERGSREYEWYDWNSLIGDEPDQRALVSEFMDGTSYFPSRAEMQQGLEAFAERCGIRARYGCRWESTGRDDVGFVLQTTDGEYRCSVIVCAVGMTEAWKPDIPGLEEVPHYVDLEDPKAYAGQRVFIVGKRNSGFEIADGLLPWARQIFLTSPRPARISVLTHSTAAARARYMQPFEDHVLGGGVRILDASIEMVERTATGFRVHARATTVRTGEELVFEVERVIAATGFTTPLLDLPDLGVTTFYQGRLPAQTPFWESTAVPGVFFAGSISQGHIGLKKYGRPGGGAAVHGFRYSARVMARHIAETKFGLARPSGTIDPDDVVPYLARETTSAPELWHQQNYLARVVAFDPDRGIVDEGILPLQHFVDSTGPDSVAVTVETDAEGDIHPAVYVRRRDRVDEHALPGNQLLDFEGSEHVAELHGLLDEFLR
jgi:thioredoxin reductase